MRRQIYSSANSSTSFVRQTPSSSSRNSPMNPSVPLVIRRRGLTVNLLVPEDESFELERLRDEFEQQAKNDGNQVDSSSSPERLCLRFISTVIGRARRQSTAKAALNAFEERFLKHNDIHSVAAQPPATVAEEKELLILYYTACEQCDQAPRPVQSALLDASAGNEVRIYAAFGGQGAVNPKCIQELRELYRVYNFFLGPVIQEASTLLENLSCNMQVSNFFEDQPIFLGDWISGASPAPDPETVALAPYSFPLIGVLGLCQYVISCKALGLTPGQMRSHLKGVTGHSQGIAVAVAVAVADTWEDFHRISSTVLELLFWIGYYTQRSSPSSPLSAKLITNSLEHGEGEPSNLLSVRGLDKNQVGMIVEKVNKSLSAEEKIYVALQNTNTNFAIAGPAHSLHGMNKHIRDIKASERDIQSNIVFDKRKPVVYHQFLPISAPFHTSYLAEAAAQVKSVMSSTIIEPSTLTIAVLETNEGTDLRQSLSENILSTIIDKICTEFVNWPAAIRCPDATHVVTFDAGGIGNLVVQIKEGHGIRTLLASDFGRSDDRVGRKSELFSPSFATLSARPRSWSEQFGPRLERLMDGRVRVNTKLTELLGLPHVTVGAMTPTTAHWDVVSAIMNAGYHAELAGGGYYDEASMTIAIKSLLTSLPKGRGITCNIIYSSPHSVMWQIPMLRRLVAEGVSIDGLSIGAGVPSPDIIKEYITTLGLQHITLKPGSRMAIEDTITIAAMYPSFPIILQWTGGRGGGHHSYEDFHDPILDLYSEIRRHDNLILVAGSGFGSAEDTYAYLTGSWSVDLYNRAPMPFDGILLGSRMMVAREAHTSLQAKALICSCPGTDDGQWTASYDMPIGGVISVKSELGQPIHKIATRAVMFWSEMDKIFALPNDKMIKEIKAKRGYIIRHLNNDFAKPYFGQNSSKVPVELSQMTYAEIISRMIDLMYVRHHNRWIHQSYETFVRDIFKCAVERFDLSQELIPRYLLDPWTSYHTLIALAPMLSTTIVDPDDEAYFLLHCKHKGQKPVNFVPVIDHDLESWMKKDSLWQSEDLDAVIDQDVQRVCILQGPVAARSSRNTEESVKDILDGICFGHTDMIRAEGGVVAEHQSNTETLGQASPAIQALCSEVYILKGNLRQPNPVIRILSLPNISTTFKPDGTKVVISLATSTTNEDDTLEIEVMDQKNLVVRLNYNKPEACEIVSLDFEFTWHPERSFYQIEESPQQQSARIKDFYQTLWLRNSSEKFGRAEKFTTREISLTSVMAKKITRAIKMADAAHLMSTVPTDLFPLDGLIMIGWDVVVKPLLTHAVEGNLLDLVHLSNKTEYLSNKGPLRIGDVVVCVSEISSLSITKLGKTIEVETKILKSGEAIAIIASSFLLRGSFSDFDQTIRHIAETEMVMEIASKLDEAVIKSRAWFQLASSSTSLLGKSLVFTVWTRHGWQNDKMLRDLTVKGQVFEKTSGGRLAQVGTVFFESNACCGNPVTDFLKRKARPVERLVKLERPGWTGDAFYEVELPRTNAAYSLVSRDCNPIHTSALFAAWVGLPGTITHGMYTSAIVRSMLESIICDGDRKRFRGFTSNFTRMVMPGEVLHVKLEHTAMQDGHKIYDVRVVRKGTDEEVLNGQAVIEETPTTYIFTGQGSQSQNMGMDLYESSPTAKTLWDETDRFFLDTYGWSILQIVRENPKSLTIYFGGKRGREIRKNYLALTVQTMRPDGSKVTEPVTKNLNSSSASYTFSEPNGLLFSTQFAQPAITLVSKAAFDHMRSKGLVPPNSTFAGHSLGEYGALSAFTDFMPFQTLMSVVFYRGLTMQVAMERDEYGSTDFSMVAINPARVGKWLDEVSLKKILSTIAVASKGLLEIVNFNVTGEQYVAAGHLRNIHALTEILNYLANQSGGAEQAAEFVSCTGETENPTTLGQLILNKVYEAQSLQKPVELERGRATIPLKGIDVPFHSSYLRPSVPAYRHYLEQKIGVSDLTPGRFLDRFIPNVTAQPFKLDRHYFSETARTTGSNTLAQIAASGTVGA